MNRIKEFRDLNGLKQNEIANWLGISKSYLSRVESGAVKLSKEKFNQLVNNDEGWDVSPLIKDGADGTQVNAHASGSGDVKIAINNSKNVTQTQEDLAVYKVKLEMMEKMLEQTRQQYKDEKVRAEQYLEMLQQMMRAMRAENK